jgi:hypothetical protein
MLTRTLALLRAHLGVWRSIGLPIMTAAVHGLVALVLCALIGERVGPFAYCLFAYSLSAALIAVPLVGELGFLLRADEASDWLDALPARAIERRLAKAGGVLLAVSGLALATLLPAALFLPEATLVGRALFLLCGIAAVQTAAATLLALQGLLARVPSLLVALEAVLVAAVLLGALVSLPMWVQLGDIAGFDSAGPWRAYPAAWFAAPFASGGLDLARLWLPLAAIVVAAAAFAFLPRPSTPASTSGRSALELVLTPITRLARRLWVAPRELAGFDFVTAAFPREREVALRTYPLLGIPLAFLWVAFGMEKGAEKDSLVALILFTPGIYLPVILSHLPATASPRARWILDTAPIDERALHGGALKAIAVRYLLPLQLVLALIAWSLVDGEFAARLALPAAAVGLLALRLLYRASVDGLPLTLPTEEAVRVDALGGPLFAAGMGLVVFSVAAEKFITTPLLGLGVAVGVFALDAAIDRGTARLPWQVSVRPDVEPDATEP